MRLAESRTALVVGLFFASGGAALVFETLWLHQAALAVGNGVWASSLVLSSFMAGLALGGFIAQSRADRVPDALVAYAVVEATVAVTGVTLVLVFPSVGRAVVAPLAASFDGHPALVELARFSVAFALLLVPSTAIGASLPLLARVVGAWDTNFGRSLGLLYGANTVGAAAGAAAAELVLLEAFGIRGTAFFAGATDVGVAVAVVLFARRGDAPSAEARVVSPLELRRTAPWLAAGFLSGFALLALEVVWLRILSLLLNDTPLALAMILTAVLTGIAAGSFAASAWEGRRAAARPPTAWVAYAAGLLGLAGYVAHPYALGSVLEPYQGPATVLRMSSLLVLPVSFASGALFTLLGVEIRAVASSDARAAGALAAANTVGSGAGPLVAGFVLLPRLGMEKSLFALLALYGVIGLLASLFAPWRSSVRALAAAVFAAALLAFPFGRIEGGYVRTSASRWTRSTDRVADVREGTTATIVRVVHVRAGVPLFDHVATNAYSMTTNGWLARRYMKLFVALPACLHPRLRRALVVGYGIGSTTEALVDDPEVETVDVAEVSRDMLAVSRKVETRRRADPLDDPRVHVHIEDGRFFLEATRTRYDLVTGEPPPPIMAGVVNLYTSEYFRLVRDRLADGGMATYWLPMMNVTRETALSIVAAFCDAFADCSLWHGSGENFVLLGTRGARSLGSDEHFARPFTWPAFGGELRALGFEEPGQVVAAFVGDAPFLRELIASEPPLVDDWPKRMHRQGAPADRDDLVRSFQDLEYARSRFQQSELVARLVPPGVRKAAMPHFDTQRLVDDLTTPDSAVPRTTRELHRVLRGTHLRLPVLLLLGSSPDFERALRTLGDRPLAPELLPHRLASRLADRDLHGAHEVVEEMPASLLPMPDLGHYIEYAMSR